MLINLSEMYIFILFYEGQSNPGLGEQKVEPQIQLCQDC